MDSPTYETIVSSVPFKFIVGPHKREFYMHSGLVTAQSQTLATLVEGPMKEAAEKCAVWPDTDEDTFVRFAKFAYTGDYDGLEKIHQGEEGAKTSDTVIDGWFAAMPNKKKDKKRLTTSDLEEPASLQFATMCMDDQCTHERATWDDGPDVLMVHARMYIFADYCEIFKLKALALTYADTRPCKSDPLRIAVSKYCAVALAHYRSEPEVESLIRKTPDLAADMFQNKDFPSDYRVS